jgi:cytochrome c5
MSEHDPHQHTSFIKTPKQLVAVIVLAFVVPVLVIAMLASLASRSVDPSTVSEEAVAKRLKPIGEVAVVAGGGAQAARTGQQVVEAVCAACHATGALNAPKIGDTKAWAPLINHGEKHLVENAIKGIRQMPPRGGNPDLTDLEVTRAVAYMVNQSGGKFAEPAAPVPTAVATAAVATAAAAQPAPQAAAKPAGGAAASGKAVHDATCAVCHAAGVAGAPKTGDKAAWAPRLKQGTAALHESALKGKGAMPPKGGNTSLSDADVKAAVDFMVGQAK